MRLIDADELRLRVEKYYGIINLPWFIREIEKSETILVPPGRDEEKQGGEQ